MNIYSLISGVICMVAIIATMVAIGKGNTELKGVWGWVVLLLIALTVLGVMGFVTQENPSFMLRWGY